MAIRDLLSAWSIDDGAAVQELTLGNNNRTYAVTTPTRRYILRIYQRSAALAWVRYEHTLLTRLAQWGLPFAIPVPIVAHTGTTLLPVPDTDVTLAALFHRLPGQPPDGAALAQSRRCGAALAELDRALGQLTIPSPPTPRPIRRSRAGPSVRTQSLRDAGAGAVGPWAAGAAPPGDR